jgi:hypothetical protein
MQRDPLQRRAPNPGRPGRSAPSGSASWCRDRDASPGRPADRRRLALSIWAGIEAQDNADVLLWLWIAIAGQMVGWVMAIGFFTLRPNEPRVLVLFGNYRGTVRRAGFHWGNPFSSMVGNLMVVQPALNTGR